MFLGFAAGVGKTYTMLEEAQRARAAGVDVVVGYIEPHDRPETRALLQGLEEVPPRQVVRGGTTFAELDVPAVCRRRAAVVLVDELAHTNPPGSTHAKRYEDVRAIVAAGCDVWTTMNVQHLESLNDQVSAITGTRQRETLPDAFLREEADEVVVVDLPPEELRARIREGRVYPRHRVAAALDGFFRTEHLTALRELALRELARTIEDRRGDGSAITPPAVSSQVADRLVVLAAGRSGDERIVRQGWRVGRSLQCETAVLHVVPEGAATDGGRLAELRQVCANLVLPLRIEQAAGGRHGVGDAVANYVRAHRVTHVLAGAARDRRLPWRGSTLQEIMDRLPWVDFIVVGDPSRRVLADRR